MSVLKEYVLNAVETQQGIAETVASHGIAILAVQRRYHGRAVHERVEGIFVERPGVDVWVYTKVACGSKKEGFALLPLFTGGKESCAGLLQTTVAGVGLECGQLRGQQFGLGCQGSVGRRHSVVHKLGGNGNGL